MTPWKEIDRADIPGHKGHIALLQRGKEFSIRTAGTELMNSRRHGSEDALAQIVCKRLSPGADLSLLIGGLGMGYTLSAALANLTPESRVTVSELVPAVVTWNRKYLAHLAQMPLNDPRVSVKEEDVANTIMGRKNTWDAILLDVDNGPEGLTRKANDRLYSIAGLRTAFSALRSGGILGVWSSGANDAFTRRLKQCGFQTEIVTARALTTGKGSRHTIWLARKS